MRATAPVAGRASQTVRITSGQTKSEVIDLGSMVLVGLLLGTMTGTGFTFEACDTKDGTFRPVVGVGGTPVDYTTASDNYYAIDPKDFYGVRFLKLVSDAAEGANRDVVVFAAAL